MQTQGQATHTPFYPMVFQAHNAVQPNVYVPPPVMTAQTGSLANASQNGQANLTTPLQPALYQSEHAAPPPDYVASHVVAAQTGPMADAVQNGLSYSELKETEENELHCKPLIERSIANGDDAVEDNFSDGAEGDWKKPGGP
ncbi:uncharacterized protein [Diadema setosum]|uniref:uncharacterized protein n=1 Tax=Diadema setosum TaxID=31175 RepID=UPI003B3A162F